MEHKDKLTQLRVGIFIAIGLAAVATMVVYFGRFGDGLRKYYELRVEYSNASGLLKGASVLLAGAKVGVVNSPPVILPNMDGVYVMLKIYDDVQIPSASEFAIGSSGLLGDRFVQINLKKDAKQSDPIKPGATIRGKSESGGFGELAEGAGDVMTEVKAAVQNINRVAQKLDSEILNDQTVEDLKKTMANLQQTSASFAEASGKIDAVIADAKKAMVSGDETLVAAKSAAEEFRKAMTDVRALLGQAKQGRGVLGALLSDREMADNLKALVANMKSHGILWYRDAAKGKPAETR
jgi:phospholipid/cholesterol/gamma-HCH transport system substrate-binding protein